MSGSLDMLDADDPPSPWCLSLCFCPSYWCRCFFRMASFTKAFLSKVRAFVFTMLSGEREMKKKIPCIFQLFIERERREMSLCNFHPFLSSTKILTWQLSLSSEKKLIFKTDDVIRTPIWFRCRKKCFCCSPLCLKPVVFFIPLQKRKNILFPYQVQARRCDPASWPSCLGRRCRWGAWSEVQTGCGGKGWQRAAWTNGSRLLPHPPQIWPIWKKTKKSVLTLYTLKNIMYYKCAISSLKNGNYIQRLSYQQYISESGS